MRVAFLRVKDLPLAALARRDPTLADAPAAVVTALHPPGPVLCCTAAARALGVRPGQTAHQARAIAPDVKLRVLSPDAVRAARAALMDAVSTLSPRVEPERDGVYVDVEGLRALHRTEGGVAAALGRAAERVGLSVAVAVAGSKGVARVLARRRAGATVVPPGREGEALARLPLEALGLARELHEAFARLGVTRVSALAALPSEATGLRLGPEAAAAVRLARGEDPRPLVPRPLPQRFEEAADFDWEVATVEPLLFGLKGLLDALVARMACRGAAVAGFVLSLPLATGVVDERVVEVAAPTRDVRSLLALARASLEKQPPLDAVRGAKVVALPGALRPVQLGLFDPPGPAPDKLALTLTRLVALVGEGKVGAPAVPDTHRPHAVAVAAFDPPRTGRGERAASAAGDAPAMALHVFRPPREAAVEVEAGRMTRVRAGEVAGRVVAWGGPWRVSGEWWGDAYDHDGYDVELDDGGLYLVAFDRTKSAWQLDGVYE